MDEKTKQEKLVIAHQKSVIQRDCIQKTLTQAEKIDWSKVKYQSMPGQYTQEEENLLLEEYNDNNRQTMLQELPDILYVGIYMPCLGDIEQNGLGIEPDNTRNPVRLFAKNSDAWSSIQRYDEDHDRECPFCGKHYYGVVAIATKNLDLNHLSYPNVGDINVYSYDGVIEGKYIKLIEPEEYTE